MSKYWQEPIEKDWYKKEITDDTVKWAERFGTHLAKKGDFAYKDKALTQKKTDKYHRDIKRDILTTSQLRKFFGEVKRQQAQGFNKSEFVLLRPKLAYAVGRAKDEDAKIHDFYHVLAPVIMDVENENEFKNFIKIFEAIVAYHKAAEESNLVETDNL
jgi:CRISPR type III-A-associated protein Csm2